MRENTKGGVPPCDRRLDRRKVAIVAFAALFLFATVPAMAVPVTFTVIPSLSTVSTGQAVDLSAAFGAPFGTAVETFVPQYPDPDGAGPITGSNITYVGGSVLASISPGVSIELLSGGLMPLAVNNTPGDDFGTPGAFNPEDLGAGIDPVGPYPGGITYDANFGMKTLGAFGLIASSVVHDLTMTWFTGAPGPRPLGLGGVFSYVPGADAFLGVGTAGRLAVFSTTSAIITEGDLNGDPIAALGTGGVMKPSWDPLDTTAGPNGTLRLPVESFFTSTFELITGVPGSGRVLYSSVGMIVATPTAPVVPEPTSLVLLGFGLVGLVTYGWRLRNRRV